jgi:hypothetical protein
MVALHRAHRQLIWLVRPPGCARRAAQPHDEEPRAAAPSDRGTAVRPGHPARAAASRPGKRRGLPLRLPYGELVSSGIAAVAVNSCVLETLDHYSSFRQCHWSAFVILQRPSELAPTGGRRRAAVDRGDHSGLTVGIRRAAPCRSQPTNTTSFTQGTWTTLSYSRHPERHRYPNEPLTRCCRSPVGRACPVSTRLLVQTVRRWAAFGLTSGPDGFSLRCDRMRP